MVRGWGREGALSLAKRGWERSFFMYVDGTTVCACVYSSSLGFGVLGSF